MITTINEFRKFMTEKFADEYPKNTWVNISATRKEFGSEIVSLIVNAYKNVPHGNLESPLTTLHDSSVDFWLGNDLDDDPDCDVILYGKNTRYGVKIIGMGQGRTGRGWQKLRR